MTLDPHGTDVASLVPMNLAPEPVGVSDTTESDPATGPVETVEADQSGTPLGDDDDLAGVVFDDTADRAATGEGQGD